MPSAHHESSRCQFGIEFHVREINGVIPRRTVVPHADSIAAAEFDEREADCVLIDGRNLRIVVDDQSDKLVAIKRRGVQQIRRREAHVRNSSAARAVGKVFHWIQSNHLAEDL